MSLLIRLLIGIALALASAASAWLLRPVSSRVLLPVTVLAASVLAAGAALSLPLYPWTNLPVLVFAVAGGVVLGRRLPARARPALVGLALLSLADLILNGLPAPLPPESMPRPAPVPPLLYGNVVIRWPDGDRFMLGVLDLLICAAPAVHWHRRGASPAVAFLPGPAAMVLAATFVLVSQRGSLALVPFLMLGWFLSEAIARIAAHRAG